MVKTVATMDAAGIAALISSYPGAVRRKAAMSARGQSSLVELDRWYQSLAASSSACPCGGLGDKDSLLKLVRWKLAREKHRPTLLSLVGSNPADLVAETLARAAEHLHALELDLDSPTDALVAGVVDAMTILTELRGVGPATASAVCAAWNPVAVFQADHTVEWIQPGAVKYTMPFYRTFYTNALKTIQQLRRHGITSGKILDQLAFARAFPGSKASDEKQANRSHVSPDTTPSKRSADNTSSSHTKSSPEPSTARRSKRLRAQ